MERQSPAAAHWSEHQYEQLFRAVSSAERLVLVTEAALHLGSDPDDNPDSAIALVGFLVARHAAAEWELENIVVAAAARNRGLGKRLLEALLARLRETGESVFLEVRASNLAARTLYERAGFRQTGCRESYYTDPPEDAVLYRWNVS